MKKNYDWNVTLWIYIPDIKYSVKVVASIHSTIKELEDTVSDILGLESFSTYYHFYAPNEPHALSSTNTLKQCNIKDGDKLTAKLLNVSTKNSYPTAGYYTKKTKIINHDEYHFYNPKVRQVTYGLIVEGVCSNAKCINYCSKITVPLGCGEFTLAQVTESLKCPACPYKDRKNQPSIVVQNISLCNCQWRCYGHYREKKGFIAAKEVPLFKTVSGEESVSLYKLLEGYKWTELNIIVKSL